MQIKEMIDQLNTKQKEVVLKTDGVTLVIAGAGSGKTKAITTKIIYLIKEKNIDPDNILAVTFTNKASKEMKERVQPHVDVSPWSLNIFTFHSFCVRIIRSNFEKIKLKNNFVIYDTGESKSVMKKVLKDFGVDPKLTPAVAVLNYIDHLKNRGLYLGSESEEEAQHEFFDYYKKYELELNKSNALDFGSIIVKVIELFKTYPSILEKYQKQFKYIMIDEYQDTNKSQFDLINMLSSYHKNLCVVGDIDQSIYSFRDADVKNILNFESTFKNVSLIKLEQNYRSTKTIIEAASASVSFNDHRKEKELWTDNEVGRQIEVVQCYNDRAEANFVCDEIKRHSLNKLRDIAIFYRTNSQSRVIEGTLRKNNIPYVIVGGMKFYERKEIKDFICYLRILQNPDDSLSLLRIINMPTRGLGKKTLESLVSEAETKSLSLWDLLHSKKFKASKRGTSNIIEFVDIINKAKEMLSKSLVMTFEYLLKETGYLQMLKNSNSYEDLSRIDNLKELKSALYEYEKKENSLSDFLEESSLSTSESNSDSSNYVTLMTVHSAKGLEFKKVIVTGLEQGLFPSEKSLKEDDPILGEEEERRLFYVAMTRAKKSLIITHCQSRFLYGKVDCRSRSIFLDELPVKYVINKSYNNTY